ncbi:MAG TPA: LysR family transcriptional regulator [Lachnospiraceae bacterium]|nr:LysR family transcriptional regulator [Lachnospiraceae bacterium]
MEIRNIISFIKIVELNSFSKAAAELGYSQSTVTMQIKQLESELQVKLFDRFGKNIALTEDGKKFLHYSNEIVTAAQNAKCALSHSSEPSGELAIGVLESVGATFLPTILNRYHTLFPQVTTVIRIGTLPELTHLLNTNQVDVIWIFDESVTNRDWIKVYEREQKIVLISSPNHPLHNRTGIQIQDILSEPFLLTEKDCSYRIAFEKTISERNGKLNIFLEIGNTEIIKKFVQSDLGLSLLPLFSVKDELERGTLGILNTTDFSLAMKEQIFYHRSKWITPSMKEFLKLITG